VVEHCKRDEDVDGCPCLRCRHVDSQLVRRSIVGDALWAFRLLGQRSSVLGLIAVLTVVTGALWPLLERGPQTWPIGTALVVYIAIHATILRAYTVAVTIDTVTDTD